MAVIEKFQGWYRRLPDKKRYLEFMTALLTVPVLLTVIVNNVSMMRQSKAQITPTPTVSTPAVIHILLPTEATSKNSSGSINTPKQCNRSVGPVEILYPSENETVQKDPVCVDISYNRTDYCALVWSYRINFGSWSEFTDKSICLFNMSPGEKKLELRVKSIASGEEILLKRTFMLDGPTPTSISTQSASPL